MTDTTTASTPAATPAPATTAAAPDSPARKNVLNSIHEGLQWCLHIAIIVPTVTILKGAISGLTYLHDELVKVTSGS